MRHYLIRTLLTALAATAYYPVAAQSSATFGFEFKAVAKVVEGTDTLRNAWAGGLNSPQFSNIDLNNDQQPDLFVFDRATNRVLPFLSVAVGTGRTWQFAPEYARLFPQDLNSWVLLRDYDCDGRPDLFTADASGSNIRVFRQVPDAQGRPGFQLVTDLLSYFDTTISADVNIAVGAYNLPAIEDVDGDGRLDVLAYDFSAPSPAIYYYRNTATTSCGGLSFRQASSYWGGLMLCFGTCGSFTFAPDLCRSGLRPAHTGGHTVGLFDVDGDGDQDLLTGRDNCPELTAVRNDGTAATARFTAASLNALPPFSTQRALMPNFPAAYPVDVTFDGRPDVVISPSLYNNIDTVDLRQTALLYRNAGPGATPRLVRESAGFLSRGDMLDVSELAGPTFGDLTGDGLVDMLVGGVSRNNARGFYRASLSFYRNVGTRTAPVFRLETSDYLGLTSRKLNFIRPVLVDLNRDGALDLVYSSFAKGLTESANAATNPIAFLLNTAGPNQPAAFNPATVATFANLPQRAYDMPCFADIDNDGRADMLLGTNVNTATFTGQSLYYYRNTGAASLSQTFTLQNNDYGQIRALSGSNPGGRPSYLSPVVADFDGDGRPDLLTADTNGDIRLFADVRAQSGIFQGRSTLFHNPLTGKPEAGQWGRSFEFRYAPAAADVNADGIPELFLGLEGGGIVSFVGRSGVVTASQSAKNQLPLQLYPNPAARRVTVEAAQPVRLTLLDMTGRIVRPATAAARTHHLNVEQLPAGIYLVRCQALTGETTVRRLEVGR